MSILKCCIVRSWAEFPCYLCERPIPYCAALTNRHSIVNDSDRDDNWARRDSELPTKSTAVSTESDRTYLEQLGYTADAAVATKSSQNGALQPKQEPKTTCHIFGHILKTTFCGICHWQDDSKTTPRCFAAVEERRLSFGCSPAIFRRNLAEIWNFPWIEIHLQVLYIGIGNFEHPHILIQPVNNQTKHIFF